MKKLFVGLMLTALTSSAFAATVPFELDITLQNKYLLKKNGNTFVNSKATSKALFSLYKKADGELVMDNSDNVQSETTFEPNALRLEFLGDIKDGRVVYSSESKTDLLGDVRRELEAMGPAGEILAGLILPFLREGVRQIAQSENVSVEGDNVIVSTEENVSADVKTSWGRLKKVTVSSSEMTRVENNSLDAQSNLIALAIASQFAAQGLTLEELDTSSVKSSALDCKAKDKSTLECTSTAQVTLDMTVSK